MSDKRSLPLDGQGRIDADVICVRCGYNLRGLAADGVCTECGRSVQESVTITNNTRPMSNAIALRLLLGAFVCAVVFFSLRRCSIPYLRFGVLAIGMLLTTACGMALIVDLSNIGNMRRGKAIVLLIVYLAVSTAILTITYVVFDVANNGLGLKGLCC